MNRFRKLSHTIYECKYHIVICPKYRYKIFEGDIAEYTRQKLYQLCREKDLVEILELNIQKDHIHLVLSVPPKYSISSLMGFLKGKISIKLFQRYEKIAKKYWGRHLWSRGYCVSTVGLDEDKIRKYVKRQEKNDRRNEQLEL